MCVCGWGGWGGVGGWGGGFRHFSVIRCFWVFLVTDHKQSTSRSSVFNRFTSVDVYKIFMVQKIDK